MKHLKVGVEDWQRENSAQKETEHGTVVPCSVDSFPTGCPVETEAYCRAKLAAVQPVPEGSKRITPDWSEQNMR
jgi:hypothetical protein